MIKNGGKRNRQGMVDILSYRQFYCSFLEELKAGEVETIRNIKIPQVYSDLIQKDRVEIVRYVAIELKSLEKLSVILPSLFELDHVLLEMFCYEAAPDCLGYIIDIAIQKSMFLGSQIIMANLMKTKNYRNADVLFGKNFVSVCGISTFIHKDIDMYQDKTDIDITIRYLEMRGCTLFGVDLIECLEKGCQTVAEVILRRFKVESDICSYLAGKSLFLLKIAHEQKSEWNGKACETAAKNGMLDCLEYLHTNGCPWDETTIIEACSSKRYQCLEYAIKNGCPIPKY